MARIATSVSVVKSCTRRVLAVEADHSYAMGHIADDSIQHRAQVSGAAPPGLHHDGQGHGLLISIRLELQGLRNTIIGQEEIVCVSAKTNSPLLVLTKAGTSTRLERTKRAVTCEPAGAGSLLCALAAAPESKTIPEIAVTSAESIRMRLSMGRRLANTIHLSRNTIASMLLKKKLISHSPMFGDGHFVHATSSSLNRNEGWVPPCPGFPMEFGGVDKLHESRTRGCCLVPLTGIRVKP
jgi:hypothetical protein